MTQQSAVQTPSRQNTVKRPQAATPPNLKSMRRSDATSRLHVLVGLFEEIYEQADYQYRHSADEAARVTALRLKFDVLRQLSQFFASK